MGKGGKAGRNPVALLRGGKSVDELFSELDEDGGGTIERDELRTLLTQLGRPAGNQELEKIMLAIDADGSGEIELAEFKIWWAAETNTEEAIDWTLDPVTGEEGYFDGNNVWITAGFVDEGGYYIEAAGQKNSHGKWCANGLLDCYAADGKYIETGHYVEDDDGHEGWEKVPGEYDSEGRWVAELLQLLPGTAEQEARSASERAELRREVKREFTSIEDAYAQIAEKESVVEMLATAKKVNRELQYLAEKRRAAQTFNAMAPQEHKPAFVRKEKGAVMDKVVLPGTLLEDGDRICIEDASGTGEGWHDVPFALLFLAVVGGTVALAVVAIANPSALPEVPPACDLGPCRNGATCDDVITFDDGNAFNNFTCACAPDYSGRICNSYAASAWLVPQAPAEDEAGAVDGSDTGLDDEVILLTASDVPLRPMLAEDILPFIVMIIVACIGSCGVAALWLLLLRGFPRVAIWSTAVSFILAQVGAGIYITVGGNGFGIMLILLAGFSSLLAVILKRWVPFAAIMIKLSMDVLSRSPLLLDLSMGTLAVQFGWMIIWCVAASDVVSAEVVPAQNLVFLVFSLFWVSQVVKNVAHVSVVTAGVAAAWYFDTQEENEKPLRASIRRALTSSFGSVCLGSLLVGILRTMNSIGRGMRGNGADPSGGNFAMVLLRGICVQYAGLFNHIVPYFNQYAFTQIAIYGLPYTAAAKASFNMVKVGGVAPLISNSVLVMVIGVGTIWCGAIAAALGVLIALGSPMLFDTTVVTVVGNAQTNEFNAGFLPVWFVAFACFFLGMAVSLPAIEAVEATVTGWPVACCLWALAIFVCYGRAPEYLEMRRAKAFQAVEEALEILANEAANDDEYEYDDYEETGEGGSRRRAGDDEYEYESDEGP